MCVSVQRVNEWLHGSDLHQAPSATCDEVVTDSNTHPIEPEMCFPSRPPSDVDHAEMNTGGLGAAADSKAAGVADQTLIDTDAALGKEGRVYTDQVRCFHGTYFFHPRCKVMAVLCA